MKTIVSFKTMLLSLCLGTLVLFSQSSVGAEQEAGCQPDNACLKAYFRVFQVLEENLSEPERTELFNLPKAARIDCSEDFQLSVFEKRTINGEEIEIPRTVLKNTQIPKIQLVEERWNGEFQDENRLIESGSHASHNVYLENGLYYSCSQAWDGFGAPNEGNDKLYSFGGLVKVVLNQAPEIASDLQMEVPEGKNIIERNGIRILNAPPTFKARVMDPDANRE